LLLFGYIVANKGAGAFFFQERPEQARRHEVRPGISGWAQCHGRNAISWAEKFKLDVWYVDHCTLWTDIKVIFITIKKVLFKEDINQVGGEWATMDHNRYYRM